LSEYKVVWISEQYLQNEARSIPLLLNSWACSVIICQQIHTNWYQQSTRV